LLIASPVWGVQTSVALAPATGPRAVSDNTEPPKASEISFAEFQFQQPTFLHGGPDLFRIEGEPVIGRRYVVEAYVFGDEAIADLQFEAVDERGMSIGPVPIARKPGPSGSSRFVGLMIVPAQPFRVAIAGRGIDGQPFRRVHRHLFVPADRAPLPRSWRGLTSEEVTLLQRMVDEIGPQLVAGVEEDVAANGGGAIVMPRMQVSNVTYAPLLSAAGHPIGLRIGYDVTFSERGQYNPEVRVEAEYKQPGWRGLTRMNVLDSRIMPMPREAFPPYDEIVLNEIRSSPLEAGAHYTYEGGTVYHFTADLVPNYAIHNFDKTRSCLYYQQFRHSPDSQKRFAQILAAERPTPYTVSIGRTAFKGSIQNFSGDGTFHQSFVAEGAQDCGEQPTRRF
jgi:hypothetical protein